MLKITVSILLSLFIYTDNTFAYNYTEAEDPMVVIFKSAVFAATEQKWSEVLKEGKAGVSLQKGHMFEADYMMPRLEKAVNEKDISKTAGLFANLVYISIREKLHKNIDENFSDYRNAKARLNIAHKSYIDIIDGNIKKVDADTSRNISKEFGIALDSLGNPGLFGIGKRDTDPAKYKKSVEKIEGLILKIFPEFQSK